MALSTTIIRFSPTPPQEPETQANFDVPDQNDFQASLEQMQPQHSKSLDSLPRIPVSCSASVMTCTRSQSECKYHCPDEGSADLLAGYRGQEPLTESNLRQLTKVDSGYCSNLNIQQTSTTAGPQSSQQWGAPRSVSSSVYNGGLVIPPSYSAEGLGYAPIPSSKPQCAGLMDFPHQGDIQSHSTGPTLFNSQLVKQYLGAQARLHPDIYDVGVGGARGSNLFSLPSTGMSSLFLQNKATDHGVRVYYAENALKR